MLLFVLGCDTSSKYGNEQPEQPPLFSYQIESIVDEIDPCDSACASATVNFPVFNAGQEIHETLNQKVFSLLLEETKNYTLPDLPEPDSLDEAIQSFLMSYEKFKAEFPESKTPWELNIDITVSYFQDNFLSLAMNVDSYTGGAHPNYQVTYFTFDNEGKRMNLDDFISDTEKLRDIAEMIFREKYSLEADGDLSDAGFIFEDNEFQLTSNFGFSETGMIFYYNSYEIAPYSEGPTVLIIPYSLISEIWKS